MDIAITSKISLIVLTFFFLNSQYNKNTKPRGRIFGIMESKIP